jgi:hypothetical protein
MVLAGLVLGIPAAMAAAYLMRSQLYGLGPDDPMTILLAVSLITGDNLGIEPDRGRAEQFTENQTLQAAGTFTSRRAYIPDLRLVKRSKTTFPGNFSCVCASLSLRDRPLI